MKLPPDDQPIFSSRHPQLTPWYVRLWRFFFRPRLSPSSFHEAQDIIIAQAMEKDRLMFTPRMAGKATLMKEMLKPGHIIPVMQDFKWKPLITLTVSETGIEATGTQDGVPLGSRVEYPLTLSPSLLMLHVASSVANSMNVIKERGKDFYDKMIADGMSIDWKNVPPNPPLSDFDIRVEFTIK